VRVDVRVWKCGSVGVWENEWGSMVDEWVGTIGVWEDRCRRGWGSMSM
jgi:hypothetical protein